MIHIDLFSGIGGFGVAAKEMGWQTVVTCEIDEFCNTVLAHHHPDAYRHRDVKTLTYKIINEELTKRFGAGWRNRPVVVTGGFPCQPFSHAGARLGTDDDRHLWPEMDRLVGEIAPDWVVGENVRGFVTWNDGMVFDEVLTDLENWGYEVFPALLAACAVDAPHERERIWVVAHRDNTRADVDVRGDGDGKKSDERRGGLPQPEPGKDGCHGHDTYSDRFGLPEERPEQQAAGPAGGGAHRVATDTPGDRRERGGTRVEIENREQGPKLTGVVEGGLEGLRVLRHAAHSERESDGLHTPREGGGDGLGVERDGVLPSGRVEGTNDIEPPSRKTAADAPLARTQGDGREQADETVSPRDAAHAAGGQLERWSDPGGPEEAERYPRALDSRDRGVWSDFPTQWPIHLGDDGVLTGSLRRRLVGLDNGVLREEEIDEIMAKAESALRRETIKGAGNAIVWPVAHEIFKAIEKHEEIKRQKHELTKGIL